METKKVKMRRLTQEEVEQLDTTAEVFVSADADYAQESGCMALGHLTKPGLDFEGGFFEVETVFGENILTSCASEEIGIYVADDDAPNSLPVLQMAGLFVNLALYIPDEGLNGLPELFEAIRETFGENRVQRWNKAEDIARIVPDVKLDVYQVATRGRKGADGPKRERIATGIYPNRVPFIEIPDGYKMETEPHTPLVDETPTI